MILNLYTKSNDMLNKPKKVRGQSKASRQVRPKGKSCLESFPRNNLYKIEKRVFTGMYVIEPNMDGATYLK